MTNKEQLAERLRDALIVIREWPITDQSNMDAMNMMRVADAALALEREQNSTECKRAFMDGIDWQHHVDNDPKGVRVYPSVEDTRNGKKCLAAGGKCGIVEIELRLIRWAEEQDLAAEVCSAQQPPAISIVSQSPDWNTFRASSEHEHPHTDKCGFDRNASISENRYACAYRYVCACGYRGCKEREQSAQMAREVEQVIHALSARPTPYSDGLERKAADLLAHLARENEDKQNRIDVLEDYASSYGQPSSMVEKHRAKYGNRREG